MMKPMHTLQPSLPLLRRTPLLPGESLVSLLGRLVQLNYYSSARILRSICCERLEPPANQDDLARPRWAETFLRLSDLTQISPEELFAASDHRFAPILAPPQGPPAEIPWIGSASKAILTPNLARERLRAASAAQYCPRCLKTAAYHRWSWVPAAAAICLEHHCLLVNQCPRCKKRISIQEIVRRQCAGCLADLRVARSRSVKRYGLGILSQQTIQSWLADADVTETPGMGSLPSRNPAVLYQFLENLSRHLLNCWKDWPALHAPLDRLARHIAAPIHHLPTLTPGGAFHLQKAAFIGILNWPQGLFQFLDACSRYNTSIQEPARHFKRVQQVYRDWFRPVWMVPEFEFMQQFFVSYLRLRKLPIPVRLAEQSTSVPWFVEQTGLWTETMTTQALGISAQELQRYGSAVSCRWPRSRKTPLFERDKVLALKQSWTRGWSVSETSSWLGLNLQDVIELAKRGVLASVDSPEAGGSHWVLSHQSVEVFFERVTAPLKLFQGDRNELVCLYEAIRMTSYLGMDCAAFLQEVMDGSLPAFKREPEIQALWHIYFLKSMVKPVALSLRQSPGHSQSHYL
jgi:hypothetical protein